MEKLTNLGLLLLDYLAYRIGCNYISDLIHLKSWQKNRLLRELKRIAPEQLPLAEWNDALTYFTHYPPGTDKKTVRELLLCFLQREYARENEMYAEEVKK